MYTDGKCLYGVASTYLAHLQPGDHVQVRVKESQAPFHVPSDIKDTPLIMVAAGTGIASFRGFIQHGAAQLDGGRKAAPALLFFCCEGTEDVLCVAELAQWSAINLRLAFNKASLQSRAAATCKIGSGSTLRMCGSCLRLAPRWLSMGMVGWASGGSGRRLI
jgi:sulfite reductase alpha subunit-like flavoprotein